MAMSEGEGTSIPKQEQEQPRRGRIPRAGEVVLLALLAASSIAVFIIAPNLDFPGDIDNRAAPWGPWGIRIVAVLAGSGAFWRLIRIGYDHQWTGFGQAELPKPEDVELRPKKTLWDWLQLFVVPLALAAIGYLFTMQQDARQQATDEQRAQEAALQAYLDQMSQLMLNENLRGAEDSELRTLARARTLTMLARLDGSRKASVVQFLYESDLINTPRPVISLKGASLQAVELSSVNLSGGAFGPVDYESLEDLCATRATSRATRLVNRLDFYGPYELPAQVGARFVVIRLPNVDGTDLSGTQLSNANLTWSSLAKADLRKASLDHANLRNTLLVDADLSDANLRGADLSDANLTGADLTSADLKGATGFTNEELEQQACALYGAIMPDGSRHPVAAKTENPMKECE